MSAISASGRFALRVARDLSSLQLVDRGMTLAAHVFTSVLPILIVAGAIRSTLDPKGGPLLAEHMGLDEVSADILEKSLPGGAQELRATGVIGVILLIIAATSFARALERSLHTIWRTPTISLKFAWRWVVAVVSVIVGIALVLATRILVQGDGPFPVLEFVAEVALWSLIWGTVSWIVLNRRVGFRPLLPGAVLAGIGFALAGVLGRVVLSPLLTDAATRFGVLGMAFTYIGWLLVLAFILLITATAGRVIYLTYTGRASRRSVWTAAPGQRTRRQ
jgi:membrane protein